MQLPPGDGRRHRLEPRSFLHSGALNTDPLFKGSKGNEYNLRDKMPVFEVVESEGGLYIGARRNAENGQYYWRITPWVMPCFTMVPPRGDHPMHGHFWIPIDDENCWAWSFDYHPVRALTEYEREAMEAGKGIHVKVDASFRPLQNRDNDYLMDRAAQKSGKTYSGIEGIGMQDASLQESMGPIQDRTKENLGLRPDNGVIMARHRLMKAAKELAAKGTLPPGRDIAHQKIRSVSVVLPAARRSRRARARRSRPRRASARRRFEKWKSPGRGPHRAEQDRDPRVSDAGDRGRQRPPQDGGRRICGTDVKLYKTPPEPRRRSSWATRTSATSPRPGASSRAARDSRKATSSSSSTT
jgi:hypothetical protein